MENSCNNCRWLNIISSEYAGVGYFECKAKYKMNPYYGKTRCTCEEVRLDKAYCPLWEQGGIKGWFNRHFKKK